MKLSNSDLVAASIIQIKDAQALINTDPERSSELLFMAIYNLKLISKDKPNNLTEIKSRLNGIYERNSNLYKLNDE